MARRRPREDNDVVTNPDSALTWTLVFHGIQFSEFFSGAADTYEEAYTEVLQLARVVRADRAAQLMPYFSISVGPEPGPGEEKVSVSLPMDDLSLDDNTVIERIEAEVDTEHRRRELYAALLPPVEPPISGARYATVASSVVSQLNRLTGLIGRKEPGSASSSGSETGTGADVERSRVSDRFGWPDELVELLSIVTPIERLTPWGPLYSLDQMTAARASLIANRKAVLAQNDPDDDPFQVAVSDAEPAGTQAMAFLDGFVPIAGDDKDYLVVDVRAGGLHGCVTVYQREGDSSGALWVSISAMLSDLADSIEGSTVFDGVWVPAIVDGGRVEWDAP